jgi:hypothetical protein
MTARQQRRLEQKLARKAAKRALKPAPLAASLTTADPIEPLQAQVVATPAVSQAKLDANRVNAQASTGPVTPEGKAVVSQNATKHGLTGKFKVLPGESQVDFDQLIAGLISSEAPVHADEIQMVHLMAEALWLSSRCVRLQNDCFAALQSGTADEQRAAHKTLALYLRYQMTHDRTFTRYATELRKRRNERARSERGFVSQKLKEAAEQRRLEVHVGRQALQSTKQEAQEIRNRMARAKTEALELRNQKAKSAAQPVAETENCLAAAA